KIGSGATAKVYAAVHVPTGSLVAVKTILLESFDRLEDGEPSRLERLRKEIQIMTLCRHPHILPVHQSFVSCSILHIVMPIMSAGKERRRIYIHKKTHSFEFYIIHQAALGLEYLHSNGLVHRDLKSANLLIDHTTGIVKLADFGVSDSLAKKASRRSFVGTPCWMAPEILMNRAYDTKVDIWSLGMTAIELASGRPSGWHLDPLKIFSSIINEPPPTLESSGCKYQTSTAFQDFIRLCLIKDPFERISIQDALSHPFLRKAQGPQFLARYLSR
ncbi:hypothetical protein PHYBLDRAFT_100427, partial [Phycomyces blakesleeanus NRRL 1555(-)]